MGRIRQHQKVLLIAQNLAYAKAQRRQQVNPEKEKQIKSNPEFWGINEDVIIRAQHRGEQLEFKRGKPIKREYSGGLWWLYSRGKITKYQADAGKLYGDCYERSKGLIRSQLNGSVRSGILVNFGKENSLAVFALEGPIIALKKQFKLISLCNNVCGEGYRIRDLASNHQTGKVDRTRAITLEAQLSIALDILAVHFGLIKESSPLAIVRQIAV